MSTITQNNNVVTKLKTTLNAEGLSVCEEDLAKLVKKNRLFKQLETIVAAGHTRSEIDKAVKQIIADKTNVASYAH